tara:strand:+ start:3311 stop:4390 length:1080 start_codon:yes stop_codon:yes gene_type:complete
MKILNLLKNLKLVKYSIKRKHGIPVLSDGMQEYIRLHKEVGDPIDIAIVNNGCGGHYENEFIFKGVKYLEDIVSAPPLNKIKIIFEIIEDDSINAFATEIDGCQSPVYFVAVNSGLVNEYANHFTQSKTIKNITKGFKALNQLPVEFLEEAALSISFCFIAYHELGHIYRGHLDYFRENYRIKRYHELSVTELSLDNETYDETRHLFECDADAFAGSLMVGEVVSRYKNGIESGLISGDSNKLLEELTVFTGSVIYYIFCLFDRDKTEFDGWYPVPPIRTSIAIGHMGAQLFKEGINEKRLNSLLTESLARTQVTINQLGMVQSTEGLQSEFERWSVKYKDKLAGLTKALVDYAPVPTQ